MHIYQHDQIAKRRKTIEMHTTKPIANYTTTQTIQICKAYHFVIKKQQKRNSICAVNMKKGKIGQLAQGKINMTGNAYHQGIGADLIDERRLYRLYYSVFIIIIFSNS